MYELGKIFLILTTVLLILVSCTQSINEPPSKTKYIEKHIEGYSGNVLSGNTTLFLDFNKEDYDKALKENKTILLYFYANWCHICKAELPKLHEAFNSLNDEEFIGFRVNYRDSDTDEFEKTLAKSQGITYQHTKVIIKNGERILKAPDSWETERYLEEINKAVNG